MTCWGTPVLIRRVPRVWRNWWAVTRTGWPVSSRRSMSWLPAGQTPPQCGVAERPGRVGVGVRGGEQHRRGAGPAVEQMRLLGADGFGGGGAEGHELLGGHLGVEVAKAGPSGAVVDDRVEWQRAGVVGPQAGLHEHGDQRRGRGVGQHCEAFGVFELGHDELGDEPGQGPGSAGQVVVIDRCRRGQSGQPAVASAGVEKDPQTRDVGAGGVGSEM